MAQTGSLVKVNVVSFLHVIELSPESVFPVLHPTDTTALLLTGNVTVVVRLSILGNAVQVSETNVL